MGKYDDHPCKGCGKNICFAFKYCDECEKKFFWQIIGSTFFKITVIILLNLFFLAIIILDSISLSNMIELYRTYGISGAATTEIWRSVFTSILKLIFMGLLNRIVIIKLKKLGEIKPSSND